MRISVIRAEFYISHLMFSSDNYIIEVHQTQLILVHLVTWKLKHMF
jgi:hypothetical protein